MNTNTTLAIFIKLGTYSNEYVPGAHGYHNLIPEAKVTSFITANMDEHEFKLYYPTVTPKQLREAIETGFNLIDTLKSLNNMDYSYGDLIKQILAFIGLAHHLKLIDDQEAQTYLYKLSKIDHDWFLLEPEENDMDLDIDLDTVGITKLKGIRTEDTYNITFNY